MTRYYEDYCFDQETGEEYVGIFNWDTDEEVDYPNWTPEDGDLLRLLNMPFDKDGRHATGWMEYVTYTSPYPHGIWWPEYEYEEVM